MTYNNSNLHLRLARTLWFNTYRALVSDDAGNHVATLRLIPALPLERSELPPDAPEAATYLTVLVEDGLFAADGLVDFESQTAELLLAHMARLGFTPEYCLFSYPSPPQYLKNQLD